MKWKKKQISKDLDKSKLFLFDSFNGDNRSLTNNGINKLISDSNNNGYVNGNGSLNHAKQVNENNGSGNKIWKILNFF